MKEFLNDLYEAMGGKHLTMWLANIIVWAIIILALPVATWLSTLDYEAAKTSLNVVWGIFMSPFCIYFINFYVFGPLLFYINEKEAHTFRVYNKLSNRTRYWLFALCNLITIPLLNIKFFMLWFNRDSIPNMPEMSPNMWIGFFSGVFMFLMLNCIVAGIAIGIRHFIRTRQIRQQLKEEKAKNTEAELAWLKNQINPHFLFNTLNNISSLTQIDPDAAQDAIAQLSDLLRYAMYETNKKTVPISGEVEFMRNYIALMKLRCNEKTEVKTTFDTQQNVEIAPLLFISLVENAFKHGVSSSRNSTIDIHLEQKDNHIVFTCDNTNYPKDDADRSGSGIGLENTRRRLELMYHDRYEWEQALVGDIYHVKITIKL
jgi:signal transduction histidine kinase